MALKQEITNGRKGGRVSKKRREEILEDLKVKFESGDLFLADKYQLAKDYNITRPTLDSYMSLIKIDYNIAEMREVSVDLIVIYEKFKKRLLNMCDRLETLNEENYEDSKMFKVELDAIKEVRATISDFTKLLEDYGYKAKAIENYNIQGEVKHKVVQVNIPIEVRQYLEE